MKKRGSLGLFVAAALVLVGCQRKIIHSEEKIPVKGGAVFEFSISEEGRPLEIYLETDIYFTEASQYRLLAHLSTPSDELLSGELVTSSEEEAKSQSPSGGVVRRYRQKASDKRLLYRLRSEVGTYHLDLQQDPGVRGGTVRKIRLEVRS